ncbi:MAG TPA: Abi-alpha family protein [Blastocatellia bacterium]|jgi:hypothetical protein|nr:Abi-alpha family protein [Blastocatellia bacterium]
MANDKSKSLDILGIKPVADSVNRLTRAAVEGAAAFLSRICLPAAEELGLLFRDKVANWRARNAVLIVDRAREKLDAKSADTSTLHAHPRIVGQIIEAGSWSETDEIQDMWGGLLASSCSEDGRDDSNLIFANLLGQLTSLQAQVINYACENATKSVSQFGLIYARALKIDETELKRITGTDDIHRIDRELDFLRALELIDHGFNLESSIADITPTALALQLYMRCKGHRGTPLTFYGLQQPSPKVSSEKSKDVTLEPPPKVESATTVKKTRVVRRKASKRRK